ncbi:MerR family DNA-binding protein [Halomonas sp. EGI 63088]|uniref:MerR family DNA-binding protein n=1 Tax=Halomonas flagellata TaxID=2920385 RepID=A0ABS9RSV6_9GAMM|nr:MerR family DNA-binding protein [Halomonas flagellata]
MPSITREFISGSPRISAGLAFAVAITLRFIFRARSLGFSVDQVADLLALWQDRNRASSDVKAVAYAHIEELDNKIEKLMSMRRTLQHLAEHCQGDHRPDCPILGDLAGATDPVDASLSLDHPAMSVSVRDTVSHS